MVALRKEPLTISADEYNLSLQEALGFTLDDLQANREGRMTHQQRLPLESRRNTWTGWRVLIFTLCIVLGAVFVANQMTAFAIGTGVFSLLFYAFSRWQMSPYVSDLREGSVKAAEGRVKLDIHHHDKVGNREDFIVSMMNKRFYVKRHVFDAFENANAYRVYFAPKSQILLSAEWLRP